MRIIEKRILGCIRYMHRMNEITVTNKICRVRVEDNIGRGQPRRTLLDVTCLRLDYSEEHCDLQTIWLERGLSDKHRELHVEVFWALGAGERNIIE